MNLYVLKQKHKCASSNLIFNQGPNDNQNLHQEISFMSLE